MPGTTPIPSFEALRERLGLPKIEPGAAREGTNAYLALGLSIMDEAFGAGAQGRTLVRLRATMIDRLLSALWRLAGLFGPGRALIALGGYGRAELAPHSDVDLLVLVAEPGEGEALAPRLERFLTFLWDSGLEIGHAVRSCAECVAIADADVTARTALLDGRLVAGDAQAYATFEAAMLGEVQSRRVDTYVADRLAEWRRRRERHGRTVYRLEPDLKLGRGGQRDLQTAMWIARVCHHVAGLSDLARHDLISPADHESLELARDFLWRMRYALHRWARRRLDRLTFDAQEALAPRLGYRGEAHLLPVEELMRDYYLAAREIDRVSRGIIERSLRRRRRRLGPLPRRDLAPGIHLVGEVVEADPDLDLEHDAARCLDLIALSEREACPISTPTRDRLRLAARALGPAQWQSPDLARRLRALVEEAPAQGAFLEVLHETGILERIFPELSSVAGLWQHDLYHAYTVDAHSLFAAQRVLRLRAGQHSEAPRFARLAGSVRRPFLLFLAALLHDVGKGEGGGHAERGAERMPAVAARLGLGPVDASDLEWLVRAHLLMSHLSQRRDLADPALIESFAAEVQSLERLDLLTLLTYVDVSTTSPGAFTEWKAHLLWELHDRTALRLGARHPPDHPLETARAAIEAHVAQRAGPEPAHRFATRLPERYLLAVSPETACAHQALLARIEAGERAATLLEAAPPETGVERLTVACSDRGGLLADLSGLLAARRRAILSAQVFSLEGGWVIDVFDLRARPEAETPSALLRDLERAATEPGYGTREAALRLRPSGLRPRTLPDVPVRIRIDNEVSARSTVIDVFGPDRLGLLHAVTAALHREGLSVVLARVATEAHRATDAFYVVDDVGRKVVDPARIERIAEALRGAVIG